MSKNGKKNRNFFKTKNFLKDSKKLKARKHFFVESAQDIAFRKNAICEFNARENICPVCKKRILDMSEAIEERKEQMPAHFDCVLEKIKAQEQLRKGEHIAYIGQGRFAIISYKNLREIKTFKIERIIEWEEKNRLIPWRTEMADLYSKIR